MIELPHATMVRIHSTESAFVDSIKAHFVSRQVLPRMSLVASQQLFCAIRDDAAAGNVAARRKI
jgi:hypothetical protein